MAPDYKPQSTIARPVTCSGVGLHSGQDVMMTLRPAKADTGVVFVRTDDGNDVIEARWDLVTQSQLCTLVTNENGITISTIEHLMSALWAAQIDNVIVELDGREVPIMDGSAQPFLFLLDCAGRVDLDQPAWAWRVTKPVEVVDGDKMVRLTPSDVMQFDYTIDFPQAAIGHQEAALTMVNGNYRSFVARARTFGLRAEVEGLRQMGLILGGSLDNAIVVDEDIILNARGLRYENEFVRHKILDAVGDLYLAGAPLVGHYHGVKASHAMNNAVLCAAMAEGALERVVR